jgi:hypothetical protein
LAYLAGIIVLLIPVILLGRPSAPPSKAQPKGDAGGVLSQMRTQYELGESTLGDVDPSSATMNLVLLGFRGLATSVLWWDLDQYKDTKNWAQMRATTESIILLQPHFQKVWIYNGWNLAYNVSAEWDDVKDRYYWVKEGAKFYKRGTQRNAKLPELYWYTGDTLGKKIGRSDEWKQFRKFFRVDPDEKQWVNGVPGPDRDLNPEDRDNYLEAKIWFERANEVRDRDPIRNEEHIMAISLFKSYPARAQLDYAASLQREGIFDEVTRLAWDRGFEDWTKVYGQELFDTPGGDIRLDWTPEQIAEIEPDKKKQLELRYWLGRYQDMTNYRYWRTRALAERESNTVAAHRELYLAEKAFLEGDAVKAEKDAYSGMQKFEKMLEDYPVLASDDLTIEEGVLGQMFWRAALDVQGKSIPKTFPLSKLWYESQPKLQSIQQEFTRRLTPER